MRTSFFKSAAIVLLSGAAFPYFSAVAQTGSRGKTIIISRGDTVINGTHFNTLTPKEKEEALKDFPSLKNDAVVLGGTGIILNGETLDLPSIPERGTNSQMGRLNRDGLNTEFPGSGRMNGRDPLETIRIAESRSNSQTFSYSNVDKNGIITHINFQVSDAPAEVVEKLTGTKELKTGLEADDLTLFPNFSAGTVTLTFHLPSSSLPEIQVVDSDYKPVFTDAPRSFAGVFNKPVNFPKNGVYYLSVKQDGKWMIKKVVKHQ